MQLAGDVEDGGVQLISLYISVDQHHSALNHDSALVLLILQSQTETD